MFIVGQINAKPYNVINYWIKNIERENFFLSLGFQFLTNYCFAAVNLIGAPNRPCLLYTVAHNKLKE